MTLEFRLLADTFAVARLAPDAAIPHWAQRGKFFSITRTPDELSIICAEENVPADCTAARGWKCLALAGPFAFDEIGVAAELTALLAKNGVSVLVVSSYETDYALVAADQVERAIGALLAAGHQLAR